MEQIIIGVDTHKSNHIAVAINTQGARLGAVTMAFFWGGDTVPEH